MRHHLLIALLLVTPAAAKRHLPHPSPSPSATPIPNPSPSPSATPIPQVTLAWDPELKTGNPDTDAAGCLLCESFVPGTEQPLIDTGSATVWTLQLSSGTTYYFVVKAYNAARVPSLPSNEVSVKTP